MMMTAKEQLIANTREPAREYAHDALSMSDAECARELNALKRHLRRIPKSDSGERAVALACIMHIRLRQLVLASKVAANEHAKEVRYQKMMYRKRLAYEAKK